jgi:hypothetical protein
MSPNQLRIIFGKLTDMSFDIARLDTLTRQKQSLQGFPLDLTNRATAGIEATIEEDFMRLAKLLGFEVQKPGPEPLAVASCGTLATSLAA